MEKVHACFVPACEFLNMKAQKRACVHVYFPFSAYHNSSKGTDRSSLVPRPSLGTRL